MKEELAIVIQQLSDKLGVTAEYLWGVLIKQAIISSITSAIWAIVFFAFAGLSLKVFRSVVKPDDDFDMPEYIIKRSLVLFACFTSAFISLCFVESAVTAIANPEYWALKQILK